MKNLITITLLFCFLGITQAQEMYHTDTLVVFDDVTFEEEIKIVTYPIVGYDTVQTNDSNYTLKPIRIWIDTLIMFNDGTFEESVTVHKHYSRNDTIGIDYYPSGEPYIIYKSPIELKYPRVMNHTLALKEQTSAT